MSSLFLSVSHSVSFSCEDAYTTGPRGPPRSEPARETYVSLDSVTRRAFEYHYFQQASGWTLDSFH